MASVPPGPTPDGGKKGIPAWMLIPILLVVVIAVLVLVPTGKGPEKEKPAPKDQGQVEPAAK